MFNSCISFICLIVLIVFEQDAQAQCSPGWRVFGADCYFFNFTGASFLQTQEFCKSMGSTMVSIRSSQENLFIRNAAQLHGDVWLGAKPWTHEHLHAPGKDIGADALEWFDGEPYNYTNWKADEPNCKHQMAPCCPELLALSSSWRMFSCSYRNVQVCRKEWFNDTDYEGPCSGGWHRFENKCLYVKPEKGHFDTNQLLCESLDATMVSLHSKEEQTFLQNLVYGVYMIPSGEIWLGAKQYPTGSKSFQWLDNTYFNYSDWGENEPNCGSNFGCCGAELRKINKMFDFKCNYPNVQVCQKYINSENMTESITTPEPTAFYNDPKNETETVLKCPRSWALFEGKCYFFRSAKATFRENQLLCRKLRAEMSTIVSKEENDFIHQLVYQQNEASGEVWLGSSLVKSKTRPFEWFNGLSMKYSNWGQTEPSCLSASYGCGLEMRREGGRWWSYISTSKNHQLCEMTALTANETDQEAPDDSQCPEEWHNYRNKCFYVKLEKANFEANNVLCNSLNATMVSLHSQEEKTFLHDLVYKDYAVSTGEMWLGGKPIYQESKTYRWADETPFDYTDWYENEPHCGDSESCCAAELRENNKMFDYRCGYENIQVCQKYLQPPNNTDNEGLEPIGLPYNETLPLGGLECPRGWFFFKRQCYYFNNRKVTFMDSVKNCQQLGAHLAIIVSPDVNKFVQSFVFGKNVALGEVWLGSRLVFNKHIRSNQWLDGKEIQYSTWGQSNCSSSLHGCALEMRRDGKWRNYIATYKNHQLCQVNLTSVDQMNLDLTTTTTTTTTTTSTTTTTTRRPTRTMSQGNGCPRGWDKFREKCFYVNATKSKFETNEKLCLSMGATMVSIHSTEENAFLHKLIYRDHGVNPSSDTWLGGNKTGVNFQWLDRSPLDYTNWTLGEPDCVGQCCGIEMNKDGQWQDYYCWYSNIQTCQKPVDIVSTSTGSVAIEPTANSISIKGGQNVQEIDSVVYYKEAVKSISEKLNGLNSKSSSLEATLIAFVLILLIALICFTVVTHYRPNFFLNLLQARQFEPIPLENME